MKSAEIYSKMSRILVFTDGLEWMSEIFRQNLNYNNLNIDG